MKVKVILLVATLTVFIIFGIVLEKVPMMGKFNTNFTDGGVFFQSSFRNTIPQPMVQPLNTTNRQTTPSPSLTLTNSSDKAKKYFIYQCRNGQECGGLADRQKGMVTAYVISEIIGAQFGIDMNKPCPLEDYMIPKSVNWIIKKEQIAGLQSKNIVRIGRKKDDEDFAHKSLESLFKADVTFYRANIDLIPVLMRNSQFKKLKWAEGLNHFDIFKAVYYKLFKLSPKTQQKMDRFKQSVGNDTLLCVHMRMGGNSAMQDIKRPNSAPVPSTVISFLQGKVKNVKSYKIFLATDSLDVNKVFKETFLSHFLEIKGKILHLDTYRGSRKECGGVEKALLDQRVLTFCDTLIMSSSGFSRMAAIYRGTDDNLFVAIKNNITVTKRLEPSFAQIFR